MKLIKVPFSGGCLGKNLGCEQAPKEIVKNLKNFYLTEDGKIPVFDIAEVNVNPNNIEETNQNIYDKAKEVFSFSAPAFFIGGDHSITYSTFKGFAEKYTNPGIVIFDAHPDCCTDFSPPTHEDFLRVLINEKKIKPENVILIGVRNWHKDEFLFLKENKIRNFMAKDISIMGLYDISEAVMELANKWDGLYISIDIDVLDPAFAPGTGYLEPGGLSTRELIYFLHRLKKLHNFKGGDIVEVNPAKDAGTTAVAAKIIVELFS